MARQVAYQAASAMKSKVELGGIKSLKKRHSSMLDKRSQRAA